MAGKLSCWGNLPRYIVKTTSIWAIWCVCSVWFWQNALIMMSELEWRHRDKITQSVWNSLCDSRRKEKACWEFTRICQHDNNWKCTSAFSKILFFMYVCVFLPFHCFIDRTALRGDTGWERGGDDTQQRATGWTQTKGHCSKDKLLYMGRLPYQLSY